MRRNLKYDLLRRLLLMVGLLVFGASGALAQKVVSGKVIGEDGMGIPGVNVLEKGTTNGTITDMDGNYSISVSSDKAVLEYSYIGYTNEERPASSSPINVTLKEDTKAIDEVVVVGYGTMKKSDVAGSSISVGADDIEGFVGSGIDQALQGKAAGVQVTANSGQPGGGMQVQIRGASTLNAKDAQPLYVIDGVPLQNVVSSSGGLGLNLGNGDVGSFSGLSNLSPDDIESMEILKDASATAIYGSRAANGVVLITTKNGKRGKAQFNYTGTAGWQYQADRFDLLNLREYAEYRNSLDKEVYYSTPTIEYQDPSLLGAGQDWQDAIFQTAFMHSHNLSASGGTDAVRYYISGGYFKQDGTILGTEFDRYNTRVNVDAQVTPWLKLGTNSAFAVSHDKLVMNNSTDGILSIATWTTPDIPVRDLDGNYSSVIREGMGGWVNPVAKALDIENKLARKNIDATVFAEIDFMPGLKLRSEYSTSNLFTNSYAFTPTYDYGTMKNRVNQAQQGKYENTYWQVKNFLTYNKTFFEKHDLTAMIGQETSKWAWESVQVSNTGLSSNDIHQAGLGTGTPVIGTHEGSGTRVSVFGRVFYGFNNKYNLTYTYRRDASSNFGPDNRWGGFHSVAASWKFSNEEFFAGIKDKIHMSNGRIRVGWGQVGNDNIKAYSWGVSGHTIKVGTMQGYQLDNIANTSVSWETQESWNFGLDLGFVRDRFNFIFEYYSKTSKDMLMERQLPSYMGTSGNASLKLKAPIGNCGEMSNKGVEITFSSVNIDKKGFKWTTDFQFSHNKNKLVNMDGSGNDNIFGYPMWDGVGQIISCTTIGKPLYQFYGYVTDGIYQDYDDLINSPREVTKDISRANGVWIGDIKYKDIDGDGLITEKDRTIIGDPNPDFTCGLTNTFSYKGWELSVFLTASYGNDVFNYNKLTLASMSSLWNNQLSDVKDHTILGCKNESVQYPVYYEVSKENGYILRDAEWYQNVKDKVVKLETGVTATEVKSWSDDPYNTVIVHSSDMPRAALNDPGQNTRISDRYVEDGSFIKIKTISIAYNFPKRWIKPVKLTGAKAYFSITNLHTFTKYSGIDPEVGVSATCNYVSGVDIGRYPSPQVYTLGLNIQF